MRVVRSILVVTAACAASAGLCQQTVPPITQAPPPIEFSDWRRVATTRESEEFSATFPSAIQTPFPENNTVPLDVFVPTKRSQPCPAVLLLHFWGAKDLRVEQSLAKLLNRKGIAAVILSLPYHLQRTPTGFRSGELAVVADVDRLLVTITQCASDCRRAIDFIASRPEFSRDRIGVAGTSLGAVVASLVYGLEPRIKVAAFMLGGVDLAKILWNSTRVVTEREQLRSQGYTESKLRDALSQVEPRQYLETRRDSNALVIAAQFDTVIPRAPTEELIAALGHPKTVWLPSGHYGAIFVKGRLLDTIATFFDGQFGGPVVKLPTSIFVPTLRLGAEVVTGSGFDLAVGVDLFRTRDEKETFGSLLITPRGPRLFVGKRIDRGLAAGVSFSAKRTGFGLFWSTVF